METLNKQTIVIRRARITRTVRNVRTSHGWQYGEVQIYSQLTKVGRPIGVTEWKEV